MSRYTTPIDPADLARRMEENVRLAVSEDILRVAKAIEENGQELIPEIPEAGFVSVFLPFFAGIGNPYNVTLDDWFGFARNPFMPVNLLDNNRKVVYQVPPVQAREAVLGICNKNIDVKNLLGTVARRTANTPQSGQAYLDAGLAQLDIRTAYTKPTANIRDKWAELFEHYGVVPTGDAPGTPVNNKVAVAENTTKAQIINEQEWD